MTIKWRVIERGSVAGEFFDQAGHSCAIRKSPIATMDMIWLGTSGRQMLLTQEMVGTLLPMLIRFVLDGDLLVPGLRSKRKKVRR